VGLFNFFKTKPAADVFWMTPRAKLAGVSNQVRERLHDSRVVLVVAHFRAGLTQIGKQLSKIGVQTELHVGPLSRKQALRRIDHASRPQALLVLADALVCEEIPGSIDRAACSIPILVFERHFLRQKDEAILSFARTLGRPYQLAFHLSLLDPLMLRVDCVSIIETLVLMKHPEWETVKTCVATRYLIKAAQKGAAQTATGDRAADSADEWVRLNVPAQGFDA